MLSVGMFVAGFASGWMARSSVDSSRGMAVAVVAAYFRTVERVRKVVAVEREHLEDLVAEGRAKFEVARAASATRAARGAAAPRAAEAPRQGRAA